jgi:hypothetical protein
MTRHLYETVGESVTSPDGPCSEQADDDKGDSHEDPSDPGKGLGGDELVAVDEVASTAVSAAKGGRVDGGSDQPEEPAGTVSKLATKVTKETCVMARKAP